MGLHKKSRDFLFQEYIKRNYNGVKDKIKRELKSIKPDDLFLLKAFQNVVTNIESLNFSLYKKGNTQSIKNIELNHITILNKIFFYDYSAFYNFDSTKKTFNKIVSYGKENYKNNIIIPEIISLFNKQSFPNDSNVMQVTSSFYPQLLNYFPESTVLYVIKKENHISSLFAFNESTHYINNQKSFGAIITVILKMMSGFGHFENTFERVNDLQKQRTSYQKILNTTKPLLKSESTIVDFLNENFGIKNILFLDKKKSFQVKKTIGFTNNTDISFKSVSKLIQKNGYIDIEGQKQINALITNKGFKGKDLFVKILQDHIVIISNMPLSVSADTFLTNFITDLIKKLI